MSKVTTLMVPRGKENLPPLTLEMASIYHAETRLKELAYVTPNTSTELSSYFNEIANECTKYIAWITYEILQAEKRFDTEKARVILDVLPVEAPKLKELGIKPNDDWRNAIVTRDEKCQSARNTIDTLKSVKMLLEGKAKTFGRAYFSAYGISDKKNKIAATPNLSGTIGQLSDPQNNFMGMTQLDGEKYG